MFADDTSIIYANNDLLTLEWLKANKMTLNIKKSNNVIFRPRQKIMPFVPQIKIFNPMSNTQTILEIKDCQISRNNDWFRPLVEESH